jgi:hypothetical protein
MADPKLTTTDLVELLKVAVNDSSIESRRRARTAIFEFDWNNSDWEPLEFTRVLSDFLRTNDVPTRRRAAEFIGIVDSAPEPFEAALSDPSWTVREATVSALARKLERDCDHWALTIAAQTAITEPNQLTRAAAIEGLKSIDSKQLTPAIPVLAAALEATQFAHRRRGLQTFAQLQIDDPTIHKKMAERLNDSHVRVRMEAAQCIERLESRERNFRFALPTLAKRMFELDVRSARESAKAFLAVSKRQPEWMWLRKQVPDHQFFTDLSNKEATQHYLSKRLTELAYEPELQDAFGEATANRLAWGQKHLAAPKLNTLQSIANQDPIEIHHPAIKNFAIKETVWLISAMIDAKLKQPNRP